MSGASEQLTIADANCSGPNDEKTGAHRVAAASVPLVYGPFLLYAEDVNRAIEEVEKEGGHAFLIMSPHILVVRFRKASSLKRLQLSRTEMPETLETKEMHLVNAWKNASAPHSPIAPVHQHRVNEDEEDRSCCTVNPTQSRNPSSPIQISPDRRMSGRIYILMIQLAGPNSLSLSQAELSSIQSESLAALNMLANIQPENLIQFWYDMRYYSISASDNLNIDDQNLRVDAWLKPLQQAMGVSSISDYVETQRVNYNAVQACATVTTKYQIDYANVPGGLGHAGRAYFHLNLATQNFPVRSWWSNRLDLLTAHEISHLFGTLDEYSSNPVSYTTPSGVDQVQNMNSMHNGPYPHLQCMMSIDLVNDFCTFSRGQLGWWPREGLHVFHNSSGSNIGWFGFDKNRAVWTANNTLPGSVNGGFGAWAADNKFGAFYQGTPSGSLWSATSNGHYWSIQQHPYIGMSKTPSAVVFNGMLNVFFQGAYENGSLYVIVGLPGGTFGGAQLVPNANMSESPASVVHNGKLFVFYRGSWRSNTVYYVSTTNAYGTGWVNPSPVPYTSADSWPSAVSFNGMLYLFVRRGSNIYYLSSSDGSVWGSEYQVPGISAVRDYPPCAVVYSGTLYVFYKGASDKLSFTSFYNGMWYGSELVLSTVTNSACSVIQVPSLMSRSSQNISTAGKMEDKFNYLSI